MRKDEKEYYKYLLLTEKDALARLKEIYMEALEELKEDIYNIRNGGPSWDAKNVYQQENKAALAALVDTALRRLHSQEYDSISAYLHDSYTDGCAGTAFSMFNQGVPFLIPIDESLVIRAVVTNSQVSRGLYEALGVDVDKLKQAIADEIARGIATDMSYGDMARNISTRMNISLNRARRIVVTEAHRIREAAAQDVRLAAMERGARILKQWDATLDGRTRKTHRRLDGQIRELDEPFEIDGKKAMYPGEFGRPEEDINCRCVALTRAVWAMDEDELDRLRERAAFFGLDKTDEFEEFKRRFLDAVK